MRRTCGGSGPLWTRRRSPPSPVPPRERGHASAGRCPGRYQSTLARRILGRLLLEAQCGSGAAGGLHRGRRRSPPQRVLHLGHRHQPPGRELHLHQQLALRPGRRQSPLDAGLRLERPESRRPPRGPGGDGAPFRPCDGAHRSSCVVHCASGGSGRRCALVRAASGPASRGPLSAAAPGREETRRRDRRGAAPRLSTPASSRTGGAAAPLPGPCTRADSDRGPNPPGSSRRW